jgi:hypothetical protein
MLFALQRRPQPLVGEVLYDPLGDQEIGELGQALPGERQPVLSRRGLGELLDLPPLAQRELRQMPPAYLGYSESRPSALKLRSTSPDPVIPGERRPGDLRHAHPLRRPRHHLHPPPRHLGPGAAAHDPP